MTRCIHTLQGSIVLWRIFVEVHTVRSNSSSQFFWSPAQTASSHSSHSERISLETKSEWKCDSTRSFQLPLVKSASRCSTELDETEAAMILSSAGIFFLIQENPVCSKKHKYGKFGRVEFGLNHDNYWWYKIHLLLHLGQYMYIFIVLGKKLCFNTLFGEVCKSFWNLHTQVSP